MGDESADNRSIQVRFLTGLLSVAVEKNTGSHVPRVAMLFCKERVERSIRFDSIGS